MCYAWRTRPEYATEKTKAEWEAYCARMRVDLQDEAIGFSPQEREDPIPVAPAASSLKAGMSHRACPGAINLIVPWMAATLP